MPFMAGPALKWQNFWHMQTPTCRLATLLLIRIHFIISGCLEAYPMVYEAAATCSKPPPTPLSQKAALPTEATVRYPVVRTRSHTLLSTFFARTFAQVVAENAVGLLKKLLMLP